MRAQMKNYMRSLGVACLSSILISGCGPAGAADNVPEQSIPEISAQAQTPETAPSQTESDTGSAESDAVPTDAASGEPASKWQVLPPEIAEVVDADFVGFVWKIEEDSFSVVEEYIEILDDGSILGGMPSTDADIPDAALVPVIFDGDAHFYLRTIYDGGERYEDTEASFQDLELEMSVELKGRSDNDGFHATEIRLIKVQ